MARLTDIAIYFEYGKKSDEAREMKRTFNCTAIPVTEIFISLMERLVVDGRGRLNIYLCQSGTKHKEYDLLPSSVGSISEYHVGHFNWQKFLAANELTRGDIVVDILESCLADICQKCSVDLTPYKVASMRTRATGYVYDREIKSLSKSTKDRKVRFSVHRTLKTGNEAWRVDLVGRDNELLGSHLITADIMSLSARYEFRHATLESDMFTILDFLKRPIFSISRSSTIALPFVERRYPEGLQNG